MPRRGVGTLFYCSLVCHRRLEKRAKLPPQPAYPTLVYPTTGAGREGGRFGMDRRAETNNNTGGGMDKAEVGRGAEIRESDTPEDAERRNLGVGSRS